MIAQAGCHVRNSSVSDPPSEGYDRAFECLFGPELERDSVVCQGYVAGIALAPFPVQIAPMFLLLFICPIYASAQIYTCVSLDRPPVVQSVSEPQTELPIYDSRRNIKLNAVATLSVAQIEAGDEES